jgi:hypothetical protein
LLKSNIAYVIGLVVTSLKDCSPELFEDEPERIPLDNESADYDGDDHHQGDDTRNAHSLGKPVSPTTWGSEILAILPLLGTVPFLRLCWRNCVEGEVDDADRTPCVKLYVYGKHAKTKRGKEFGALLYEGVRGFQMLKEMFPNAKPDDPLFPKKTYKDGFEQLMVGEDDDVNLREVQTPDGRTVLRSFKSLRSTAVSLGLDRAPNASFRSIAKWARTKPIHIENFYDQTHPENVLKDVTGFKPKVRHPKSAKEAERMRKSDADLKRVQEQAKAEREADAEQHG